MSHVRNKCSGNGAEELRHSGSVVKMIDNSSKQIIKEIQEQMTVLLSHLSGLGKYMELMQKVMEHLKTIYFPENTIDIYYLTKHEN